MSIIMPPAEYLISGVTVVISLADVGAAGVGEVDLRDA
jgi:hypothetical protein